VWEREKGTEKQHESASANNWTSSKTM